MSNAHRKPLQESVTIRNMPRRMISNGGNDGGNMDLEPRVARIESHIEHIDKSLDRIDSDVRDIRSDMRDIRSEMHTFRNHVDSRMEHLHTEIKSNFKWLLGIFIPLSVTGTAATVLTTLLNK